MKVTPWTQASLDAAFGRHADRVHAEMMAGRHKGASRHAKAAVQLSHVRDAHRVCARLVAKRGPADAVGLISKALAGYAGSGR